MSNRQRRPKNKKKIKEKIVYVERPAFNRPRRRTRARGPTVETNWGRGRYARRQKNNRVMGPETAAQAEKSEKEGTSWWNTAADVAGHLLGSGAASLGKSLVGLGDYNVESNSVVAALTDGEFASNLPTMRNAKNANVIQHREYITDILANQNFTLSKYPINPGMPSTFPWGSPIGANYEQYRLLGMVFEFKTLSSDYTGTPNLGYVIMATLYNSAIDANNVFLDKRTMENHSYANSCKPSISMVHPIECARSLSSVSELYIRTGAIVGDNRLNDMGTFCIATGGQAVTGGVLGELWVTYEWELFNPKATQLLGASQMYAHYQVSGAFTVANPWPAWTMVTDSIGISLATAKTITFPLSLLDESFMICIYWAGTGAQTITGAPTTLTNCTNRALYTNDTLAVIVSPALGTASLEQMLMANITITSGTSIPTFLLNMSGTLPTGTTSCDIFVISIPTPVALKTREKLYSPPNITDQLNLLMHMKREKQIRFFEPISESDSESELSESSEELTPKEIIKTKRKKKQQ